MSIPDGVYTIKNVGRNLQLDLQKNNPFEGAVIWGYVANGTTAQQWIVKNQNEPGSQNVSVTIQSNNDGNQGSGFFAAKKQDAEEPVTYTRKAWLIDLIPKDDDTYL
ncbi:hypothetical protein PILCRDRAFT_91000 [Piloderma croceum F 1598]|uniref:Ricin B lectin domain-containing protein n=1 Tax=Piloderma croceum (strain F 1598) TaxID=765440 RepID=A0A0C3FDA0_PILCF|nr:hypothetical protein PILCRDRAFT_91000 [Piloderma croceum F 1598]